MSDGSDSSEYESDSGSAAISQSLVSNAQMPQNEDMEIIRRLQLENQTLKKDNLPDELKAFDAELATFSCKYGIIAEMFPPMHCVLKLTVPNPPPTILSGSHYETKSAEELCLVTELYSLLPDHLHRFVPTTHFQSLLEHHLQGGRSSEIGKLRVMTGRIFGLDPSYFNTSFTKRDMIPEIQKLLGRSLSSKFLPILFTRQELDPTMSTVFGNWELLANAIRIVMFGKNSLDIVGWPRAKCNAQKWGITLCTPGLLSWGWVALIFILSLDTSFTKDKQLWVTLWEEPRIVSIHQKIDAHVWQSSTSNAIVASEAEGEDFTFYLMHLALTNAGRNDPDTPTTDLVPPPAIPVIAPATSEDVDGPKPVPAPVPGPTVQVPVSDSESLAANHHDAIVPFVPAGPGITEVPDVPGPSNEGTLPPTVASGTSSAQRGRAKKAGVLAPISLVVDPDPGAAGQRCGWATRTRKK
ncbi:uncharacterized protein EDB91DRAFT_1254295 [Suillus paluster]|uniref:uncharacterized protein n=1 Tax=Suillus paluster TaxID=48578 RepID=UPI001B87086A|nr:uncharacterized protein EDB91DRAFT_1254295 [Suillus paluster]KAG1726526.1 hypothetical protein EDB91DRAFT_1254295 [Suillus paluster]